MKIATFNINNIRRRLPNLLSWLREAHPDVVCLQELKTADAECPAEAIKEAGYEAIWRGQKTWNGVAILSKSKPIKTLSDLPGDPTDTQSRYIEAAVNGIVVASLYAPNGNPQPGPKFDYKLAWLRRLSTFAAELLAAERPSYSRETITSFPLTTTSIPPNPGTRTHWFSLRAEPPLLR
jgi:exodeoxyribonuclease-3